MVRRMWFVVPMVALLSTGVACGSSDDSSSSPTTASASIEVSDPWCRTSAAMAENGACYMQIANDTDEASALVSASVPTTVAARTELHETTTATEGTADASGMDTTTSGMSDDTATSDATAMGGSEMMGMRPVESIALPAHETTSLEPGGYHVMLLELAQPLTAGAEVTITLTFEGGATLQVDAVVRDQ